MEKSKQLKKILLFKGLDQKDMMDIASMSQMCSFDKGEILYRPGETGEVLFILKEGRVRIFRLSPSGKEITLADAGPGSIFGEMTLLGKSMQDTFAEAAQGSLICKIRSKDLEQILTKKPDIALRLLRIIGQRMQLLENRLYNVGLNDVSHRLADIILELTDNSSENGDIYYTHDELSKMIGASRESVTLSLGQFKESGWISTANRKIKVLDISALKDFTNS